MNINNQHHKNSHKMKVKEILNHHQFWHKFWSHKLNSFNKKHHKFSKKVFLTFGLFTITTLFLGNLLVSGAFSLIRRNQQKNIIKKASKDIMIFLDKNKNEEEYIKFLEDFMYQEIYIKLVNIKNNKVVFDTYTGFWRNSKEKNHLFFPLINNEFQINSNYKLYILKDIRNEQRLIAHYILIMLFLNFILVFFIMKISKLLTLRLLLPINHIIQTAENINAENLSYRVPVLPIDDELSKLARVINQMIGRLELSFNAQKRFVSDASHELRTPLQIIKGYTDLALTKGMDNKKILEESLLNVKEEAERMIVLTENLLLLAKSEEANLNFTKTEVNLFELFIKIKNDLTLTQENIEFTISPNKELSAFIDKKLMLQAFRAVIDNSIKYSNDNIIINVDFFIHNYNTIIIIQDKGIGIADEKINKIFDRFYRVDEARSKEIGGSGLGLAIVKNIIELHGGKIEIKSEIGKGTLIKFILPKALN